MSFGQTEAEFDSKLGDGYELSVDSTFTTPDGHQGITFVAATGDDGSPGNYPAFSPNVLAVGGTSLTITRAAATSTKRVGAAAAAVKASMKASRAYQNGVQDSGTARRRTWPLSPIPTRAWPFTIPATIPTIPRAPGK